MQAPEPVTPPEPAEDPAEQARFRKRMDLVRQAKGGINWFYWVAALSIINTIITLTGGLANFFLGFGLIPLVNALLARAAQGALAGGTDLNLVTRLAGAVIDLALGGVFLLFGYLGQRSHRNWILVGIALYTFDGFIFLLYQDWLGVLFHAYVIYSLIRGLRAMDALSRMGSPTTQSSD